MADTLWQEAEKDFQEHFMRDKGYVWRVPDAAEGVGRSNGKINRNVRKAPSDFIVCKNGVTFHAEVKCTEHEDRFLFSLIKPKQIATCRQITHNGGEYWFFVKSVKLNQWFRIPGQLVLDLKDQDNPVAHIKFAELTSFTYNMIGYQQ